MSEPQWAPVADDDIAPLRAPVQASGLRAPGNIDLHHRPVVHNPDGTISTVRSISIGTDKGEVLIPTVSPDGRVLTDDEAAALYRQTGQHLGIFDSPAAATAYAESLHNQQAQEYGRKPPSAVFTPEEQARIVDYARHAQTPQDLREFAERLGHDRGLTLGNAEDIIKFRDSPPDGAKGRVSTLFNAPKGAPDAVKAAAIPEGMAEVGADTKIDYGTLSGLSPDELRAKFDHLPDEMKPNAKDAMADGLFAGFQIDAAGGTRALMNAVRHPVNAWETAGGSVGDAYQRGRQEALARLDYYHLQNPNKATALQVGGALLNPVGAEARGVKGLAAAGAGYGAVSGFEHTQGSVGDRATAALKEGAVGAVAAPIVGAALKAPGAIAGGVKSVLGGSPDLARRIVSKAIRADGNTAAGVGAEMAGAHGNEVPYMIADSGDNARGLLASAVREPGPARTLARDALEERQSGLTERVTNAIQRDLGPVANPHEVADRLMTEANGKASPLYEAAYARPGASTFAEKVAPLLQRPSMGKALANAYRLAQEEGRDPTTLGFDLGPEGEVVLSRVPSWQSMDYVKRGMDDVVESYRDTLTGRLKLDTEGRAVNNTLRSFIGAFDKANPEYAAARAAYAGPVRGIEAMNQGRKALNMTADDLEARMRDMTPFEKQMFALGHRRAMAETVESKGDTADVINTLAGTGKKRAMLARLHGDRQAFGRFVDTLSQEREGFRTFKRGMLGSPTALNLADDGQLKFANAAADFVTSGFSPVAAISQAIKFGFGKVGTETKKKVAALLSETDPARFKDLVSNLRAEAERRGLRDQRIGRSAVAITRDALTTAGQPAQYQDQQP